MKKAKKNQTKRTGTKSSRVASGYVPIIVSPGGVLQVESGWTTAVQAGPCSQALPNDVVEIRAVSGANMLHTITPSTRQTVPAGTQSVAFGVKVIGLGQLPVTFELWVNGTKESAEAVFFNSTANSSSSAGAQRKSTAGKRTIAKKAGTGKASSSKAKPKPRKKRA